MPSDRYCQDDTLRHWAKNPSERITTTSVHVHGEHSSTTFFPPEEHVEALDQSYSTLPRSSTFTESDVRSGGTPSTHPSSFECPSLANSPPTTKAHIGILSNKAETNHTAFEHGNRTDAQNIRDLLSRSRTCTDEKEGDGWTLVNKVVDMNLESKSQSITSRSCGWNLCRSTSDRSELRFDETESQSFKDFNADPSHQFWTWSQDKQLWYHEDMKTGKRIWCPKELD